MRIELVAGKLQRLYQHVTQQDLPIMNFKGIYIKKNIGCNLIIYYKIGRLMVLHSSTLLS